MIGLNRPTRLDCLHKFEVKAGVTYLMKGGVPHAIGAGCLLIEVREPTDYTIRTERTTPRGLSAATVPFTLSGRLRLIRFHGPVP